MVPFNEHNISNYIAKVNLTNNTDDEEKMEKLYNDTDIFQDKFTFNNLKEHLKENAEQKHKEYYNVLEQEAARVKAEEERKKEEARVKEEEVERVISSLKQGHRIIMSSINNNLNLPEDEYIKKNINNDTNNISYFTSLIDNNIELINLNYTIKIESKQSIKLLSNIKNCLYFFFNIISDKTKEKIYRYKRVSNYNEMNDKDAFIIELIKQKETPVKIIQQLKENFKLSSTEEASKIFETTIQSLNLVQNIFNYRKLKIKNSPGFLFKIDNNINNQINISIENIDNIRYIYFIKLYIDSIFKMSFNDIKDIDLSICKSSKK